MFRPIVAVLGAKLKHTIHVRRLKQSQVLVHLVDFSSGDRVQDFVQYVVVHHGQPDGLVHYFLAYLLHYALEEPHVVPVLLAVR